MTPVAVLAILVTAGEANAAPTTAMAAAAAEVVGDQGSVQVAKANALSDAEALRVERALGVRAVVQLAWDDADHLRARLRLHAARTDRWIDRDLSFVVGDTPAERGRALGFAMASMLPEGDPTLPLATREAPRAATPEAPPGANALAATFLAGVGADGPAGGLGGGLGFERFVAPGASLGVALAARLGSISTLDARELTSSLGVGGALWPVAPTAERRLGVALRGEALLLYEAVNHVDAAGTARWKSHLLPGAAFGVEGTYRASGPLELVVGAGAEFAFGTVDVTVVAASPGEGKARIPVARGVAEAGIRLRF